MSAHLAKDEALAALRRGDPHTALAAAERAVAADPSYAEGWAARGTVKLVMGDAAASEPDLARAAELKPVLAEAHLNRSMALISLGRLDDALAALQRVHTADPALPIDACLDRLIAARQAAFDRSGARDDAMALALTLRAAGRAEAAEAVLRPLSSAVPDDAGIWELLGDLALRQGHYRDAEMAARKVADLRTDDPDAAANISGILFEAGDRAAATTAAEAAANMFPRSCRTWLQVADILDDDSYAGWDALRRAAQADDTGAAVVSRALVVAAERVEWDLVATLHDRLAPLLETQSANPLRLCFHPTPGDIARRNAERFSAALWPARRGLCGPPGAKERLRIGYLSPDFRSHPIGIIIRDLFRRHDRDRFEVYAYAVGPASDSPERRAIEGAVDRFAVLSDLSDYAAARRIRDDDVDILVELAGHTLHGRMGVLSYRPAPLQIHYLGYPGTTGAAFVDYIVGDPWTIPHGRESHFTEAVIRLPQTYLINSHRAPADAGWDRARFGFTERDIVLCSFNHPTKITREMFDAWMRILSAVREAVLWLWIDHPAAAENLAREAGARGVDPARLRFAPRADFPVHLARYAAAELALDTAPYNGHATVADALWMGCPVLTCPGDSFASRVGASLLDMIGLQDLIAADIDEYVAKAITHARDPLARRALRDRLDGVRDGILFDTANFTRDFEAGLSVAWARSLAGLAPETFDVPG